MPKRKSQSATRSTDSRESLLLHIPLDNRQDDFSKTRGILMWEFERPYWLLT
jgi:hypothetical protein